MTLTERLARAFLETHPVEAAQALERLTVDQRVGVLRTTLAAAAAALRHMTAPAAAESLAALTPAEAAPVLDRLSPDVAVGLLRRLPPETAERLFTDLPAPRQDTLRRGLRYPTNTAGALMDPLVFAVADDISLAEARLRLRREPPELLHYVFVVDREGVLVGVLDIPQLMRGGSRVAVRDVMRADVERLPAWTPAAAVRTHGGWQRSHEVAVTDESARLIGVIRYQTLRRLEQEEDPRRGDRLTTETVGALGELFHLGLAGIIEGVAAAAAPRAGQGAHAAPGVQEER